MFALYFNKTDRILRIETSMNLCMACRDKVTQWNDCYYTCNTRKPLRAKAEVIKIQWIEDTEKELEELKRIKVATKYNKIK